MSIAKPSPELKSTALRRYKPHAGGQDHELYAEKYLKKKSHCIYLRRTKLFGVEIDLTSFDSDGVLFLSEVKSFTDSDLLRYRIKSAQKKRLLCTRLRLSNYLGCDVGLQAIYTDLKDVIVEPLID